MEDRDLDALVYELLEDDTDRRHGEAIIAMVDAARERQNLGDDPLLKALDEAHRARMAQEDNQP